MQIFRAQTLSSTHLDSQGERLAKELLVKMCSKHAGKAIALHQRHDMALPVLGFVKGLRVEKDPKWADEWLLVGDVHLDRGSLDEALKGFSISTTVPLRPVENPSMLLYIPYPAYNNQGLVEHLSRDASLSIGKLIRKAAEVEPWALVCGVVLLIIKPAWEEYYDAVVSPAIHQFLDAHFATLSRNGLALQHVQMLSHEGHEVEIRFVPPSGKERSCMSPELLRGGISTVVARLSIDQKSEAPGVERVVLTYDVSARAYEILRIEYKDATVSCDP